MHRHQSSLAHILARALRGHFNLQFVVLTTTVLFWIVLSLILFMLLLRFYYYRKRRRIDMRRKFFEPAIELVLMEEPVEKVVEALRPRHRGDEEVVQEVVLDAMQPLIGSSFELLQEAARRLGLVERSIKRLNSPSKFRRGQAMEALGIMRIKEAIAPIAAQLPKQTLDMKLVALRSLALIGDPAALPLLSAAADSLPPAMLPRLASLMLEFDAAAKPFIKRLIDTHAASFPPRIMKILQEETAAAESSS